MILYITRSDKDYGIGHLKRTLNLARITKDGCHIAVLTSRSFAGKLDGLLEGTKHTVLVKARRRGIKLLLEKHRFGAAVIDAREISVGIMGLLAAGRVPVVSLDDYVNGIARSEVVISPLPHFAEKFANFTDWIYNPIDSTLQKASRRPAESGRKQKVLVTFGGSDPKNMAYALLKFLLKKPVPEKYDITLVEGPLSDYRWAYGIKEIEMAIHPPKLAELIGKADIVFTSVGMTLMESLYLGAKTVTVNPTPYHDRIAASVSGVINLGLYGSLDAAKVAHALEAPAPDAGAGAENFNYARWYNALLETVHDRPAVCPLCGSAERRALSRGPDGTLFECAKCRSNFSYTLAARRKDYSEGYFHENHVKAYGKTYMEDAENIRAFARRRLKTIGGLAAAGRNRRPKLLDAGSAMGLFCDEANRADYRAEGLEISQYARDFAKKEFGVEGFSSFGEVTGTYDVITLWFTLEHIADPGEWVALASKHLVRGGLLAVAVPNGRGALARFNPRRYLELRPAEHCFEPSVGGMKALLRKNGFRVRKVEIFGLHPERVKLPEWPPVKGIQKFLRLGDTYEIYAEKIRP